MSRRVRFLTALALLTAPTVAAAQTASSSAPQGGAAAGSSEAAAPESNSTASTDSTAATTAAAATPSTSTTTVAGASTSIRTTPAPEFIENRATPIIDLHGYIRTRFELFQNYTLGWGALSQRTGDATYLDSNLPWYRSPDYSAQYCGQQPAPGTGSLVAAPGSCNNPTQTSANMRLRLNPEIHPTEFIGIYSQIDILDNLVLGSTPEGYYTGVRSGWAPFTSFSTTQIPPIFNYNGFTNSIVVKRAWAEVTNPTLGQIRFGRMPSHWGLGILANAGNGLDSDYQSTSDRVMYAIRLRNSGLFGALMWDFASTGPSSANVVDEAGQGQPYDLSQFDDVHQWIAAVGRRMEPEQARQLMSRGGVVFNGGLYFVYRTQYLTNETSAQDAGRGTGAITACSAAYTGHCAGTANISANAFIPDLWLQLLGRDFRLELEATYIRGSMNDITLGQNAGYTINQFGGALEAEYRALNQRLTLGFRSGYASGDADLNKLNYQGGLAPAPNNDRTLSLFRFHPDYRIDLILWRALMRQISGAYYFRPSVQYNFVDEPGGDLLFGRVDVIWSRASEFLQTRGHHADLGVEIDATVQYESNHRRPDGTNPTPAPGFYANVQGGVLFPLGGLGATDGQRNATTGTFANFSLETAFTIRALLGVQF